MTNPQDPNQPLPPNEQWAQTQINASGGQQVPGAPFSDAQYSGGHYSTDTGDQWSTPQQPQQGVFGQDSGPVPGYGTSGPQQFGQPGVAPAWGPAGAPPPNKSNKKLFIGLGIGGALLVIVLVVSLIVVFAGGDDATESPEAAVQTYLDGLAAGDAKKALEVTVTPASDKLLTDEIVKKQREVAPITDIKVRKPDSTFGSIATVNATYKHGDKNVDEDIQVRKSGDTWRVEKGALDITLSSSNKAPGLSLFGVDVSNDTKVYVFPGPLVWGSSNVNIAVADTRKEFPLGPEDYFSPSLESTLSTKGKQVVNSALDTYFTNCATSKQSKASVDRPGCGQYGYSTATAGSVRWTKPTDLSELSFRFDYDDPSKVKISGSVKWSYSYTSPYRGAQTDDSSEYLSGTVDLTAATPTFTPGD
ncbi:hypothetical protein GOEFS_028_00360 [Gordonia effusa NBRC 100432]|uniref:DUF4878 domain-containing protein n=1 Tax=Gordonia effusa NBRC 100432 TaxID=1077974 RepID=H0QX21_9ACTN|nr:hypothetical protein [Gordonia effusa]GAB17372.1 hypothetical protein GOEFS_028_00360 [Gordonia effusa NBRC 100432]